MTQPRPWDYWNLLAPFGAESAATTPFNHQGFTGKGPVWDPPPCAICSCDLTGRTRWWYRGRPVHKTCHDDKVTP